jgi:hypothetical protein
MKIYGVAILAICFLIGHISGDQLGRMLHMVGNFGGVGFAMLLLIFVNDYCKKKNILNPETESGMLFWSTMYIPVVVAMSASQNVQKAIKGGWAALLIGVFATLACFMIVPLIIKMSNSKK